MRKVRLKDFLPLLSFCSLIACSSSEKQLVVYSPHGKEILNDFASRFEKANPGVKVQWLDMGSQDVLDRVRSESVNPQADIWWGAPSSFFMNAAEEGLLQAYRPSWAGQVRDDQHDPDDFWYGTFQTPEVIAFNSQVLSRDSAPQDWDELLDKKWQGKIVIRSPMASGTMRAIYAAMIWRFFKASGSAQEGYDWLLRLDANTKSYPANPTLMYLQVARQEALLTLWNMPDIELQKQEYGYPFDYVIPQSGTPVLIEGLAIIANCKQSELAEKFYEYITTREALVIQAEKYFRIPVRSDIPKNHLPPWISATEIKPMNVDWKLLSEKSKEWMSYWDRNVKGAGKH